MFGNDDGVPEAVKRWLELLKERDDDGWAGPLVVLNVQEDGNVPPEIRERVVRRVEAAAPDTVEDSVALFDEIVRELYDYSSRENERNRRVLPFEELGRVVTRESFIRHLIPSEMRYMAYEAGFRIPENLELEGFIHSRQVFAAPLEAMLDAQGEPIDPDEIRNLLGLDAPGHVRGARLMILRYGRECLPHEYCWRPTVLDAGRNPAFLPSEAGAQHGRTQHLETGEPAVAEIVHEPFPANNVRYRECEPLRSDPPNGYRARRLEKLG